MSETVSSLIPYVHVADVERSIAFYWMLGFEVADTRPYDGHLGWAFLQCGDARLMLAHANAPIDSGAQAVLFYLWCRDVAEFRRELVAQGVEVGPITHPEHMPAGEIQVHDPDGYSLLIGQRS
jgi:catechol 2,3-dioxygenase-like lactoylglutathione lyase family enzyme